MQMFQIQKYRIIKFMRQVKIEKRLKIFLALISVIPILFIGIYSALKSYSKMKEMALNYSKQMVEVSIKGVQTHFFKYENQITAIENNEYLMKGLSSYDEKDWDEKKQIENNMRLIVDSIFGANNEVDTVELISQEGTRFYYPAPITSLNSNLLHKTRSQDKVVWSFSKKETKYDGKPYIIISKGLKGSGYILIALNKDYVDQVFQKNTIIENSFTMLLDASNNPITNITTEGIWLNNIENYKSGVMNTSLGKMFITFHPIQSMEWTIVHGIPYSYLLQGAQRQIFITIILIFLLVVIVWVFTKVMMKSITSPLEKLMKAIQARDIKYIIKDSGSDEYHQAIAGFNAMNQKLDRMVAEVYEMKLEESKLKRIKKEVELSALHKQINPHFLYNTLESIYWNGQYEGVEEISEVVIAIGNYFRAIINKGQEFTFVKSEVESVDNYLYLQNIRFNYRISIKWTFNSEIEEKKILKLVLQPVIEDIITQLLDFDYEKINISIVAEAKEKDVIFRIKGKSISCFLKSAGQERRTGCTNVDQRLKLYFGKNYGIWFAEDEIHIIVPQQERINDEII